MIHSKSRSFELAWLETETKRTGKKSTNIMNQEINIDEGDWLMTNTSMVLNFK